MPDKHRILVTGNRGMLAYALVPMLEKAGFEVSGIDVDEADITNKDNIIKEILRRAPEMVIHTAAMTAVDACEDSSELANAINGHGAGNVALGAAETGAAVIHISTDYVFEGIRPSGEPYAEDEPANPRSAYGKSKALGEEEVRRHNPNHYILRTAWLYGPNGKNFVDTISRLAMEREQLRVVSDQKGSPTLTVHLSAAITHAVIAHFSKNARHYGIFHITNSGSCTWFEFAQAILGRLEGHKAKEIIPIDSREAATTMNFKAPRPMFSVMNNEKFNKTFGFSMPSWQSGLDEYMDMKRRGQ